MPHLSEVFVTGAPVEIKIMDGEDLVIEEVWISKLNSASSERAITNARTAQTRRKRLLETDYKDALDAQVDMPKDELVDANLAFERSDIQRQAYERVLHDDKAGSDWSEEGFDLVAVANAIAQRAEEVAKLNEEIREAAKEEEVEPELLVLDDDEEYARLVALQTQFFDEVNAEGEKIRKRERAKLNALNKSELAEKLRSRLMELELKSVWYEEYRKHAIFYAARYRDDKKKQYFTDVDQVDQLPDYVFDQLWAAFDEIALSPDQVKK